MDPKSPTKGDAVDLSKKTDALKGKKLKIKRLVKRDDGHYSIQSVTVQSESGGQEQSDRLLSPKSSKHKHNLYELTNYSSHTSKEYSNPTRTYTPKEDINISGSNLITPGGFLEKL